VPVYFQAAARMGPDEPGVRVVTQRLLDFGQVQRVALALGRDVGMQQYRQVALGGQVVDAGHGLVVGPWRIAAGQCSEVIVAGEHFADALPQPRIQLEHALDVADGVLVHRVETRKERVETPPLRRQQLFQGRATYRSVALYQ
jgi:hypothetical protein